jgi:hypothetical protein
VAPDPSVIPGGCENDTAGSAITLAAPRGRPKRRRTYTRHGLNALMVRVKLRGFGAIDRRMLAARTVLGWRSELLEDLGGQAAVSAAQLALVDVAVRTRLYLDHVDAVLLERKSLVVRGRRLLPLVEQRQKLADGLARVLGQLGLERRQKPPASLEAYVQERYGRGPEPAEEPPGADEPGSA